MSEKKKKEPEWLTALKDVRDKDDDPVVDGLVNIGSHTLDATDALEKRIDKTEETLDGIERRRAKDRDSVEAQMEAGFKAVSSRVESLSKRQVMTAGGGSVFEAGDRLMAAIPDEQKHLVYEAERRILSEKHSTAQGRKRHYVGTFADPAAVALSELWFKTAARLQLPKYFGGEQSKMKEELDRMMKAFEDVTPGAIRAKAAYSGAADATGGYATPTLVAAEVLRIAQDSGVVVSRARHLPQSSDTMHIPNEATGVTVYWPAQGGTLTSGENTLGVNILEAKKVAGRSAASLEVVSDASIGLLPYIQTIMAEKIGKELDAEALEGTGTNFTGLVTEGDVNSVATTTTDGEALTFADLVAALYAADESSVEDGAAWFMHRKIFATVVNLRADAVSAGDAAGAPIFVPSAVPGVPGTILGFPVYTTSACSVAITRGSTGDTGNVYFGDPRRLIFGDSIGLRWDVTETGPGWEFFQVDMRLVGRWGFTVGTPAAFSKIVGCTQLS